MNNAYKYAYKGAVIAGLLLGSFGVAALADWTPPANQPPNCPPNSPGCDAPINVGNVSQTKNGALTLSRDLKVNTSDLPSSTGLQVWGKSIFKSVQISEGTPAAKKILASKDASGNATWMTLAEVMPTGGSGNIGWVTIDPGAVPVKRGAELWSNEWSDGATHSANSMCTSHGYTEATGACKYTYNTKNYITTLMSNNETGQWQFTCNYGPSGNRTYSPVDAQILCIK